MTRLHSSSKCSMRLMPGSSARVRVERALLTRSSMKVNLDQSTVLHRARQLVPGWQAAGGKTRGLPARISVRSYFHSQTLEVVAPAASTSYSKAPQPEPSEIFWELVRKNNMPR